METGSADAPLRIWAVTDGRAGNRAQALGLAEALARRVPARIEERMIAPSASGARLPAAAVHALGRVLPGWPEAALEDGAAALRPPWPGLVIGAGRRAGPCVAALRRRTGIAAVQLLSPQMPARAFDLVIAPGHDGLRGPNVIETVGALGRLTPERIAAEAEAWRARLDPLPRPRLAVMIGGPSRSARFGAREGATVARAVERLAATHGVMATLSRRTPAALGDAVRTALGDSGFLWAGEGENPYPGILGLADAALVTADSVNMASEAAATGLPVHVIALPRLAPKLARFHAALAAHGATRPYAGRIERWSYPPLAEADRVAGLVLERLGARLPRPA